MNKAWNRIKQTFEENPLAVIAIGVLVVNVTVKVLHEVTNARNSKTWEREVDRRRMMH